MLRVHELDKEMSGEDRFHLENISFHLPKGYICGLVGEKTEQAKQLFYAA